MGWFVSMLDKYLKLDLKIEQVSQIKCLLGITFNVKLTWKPHIQQICSKLFFRIMGNIKIKTICRPSNQGVEPFQITVRVQV